MPFPRFFSTSRPTGQHEVVRWIPLSHVWIVWSSIDVEQQEALMEMIGTLLDDKEPLVLGSACFAFNQLCPDRWDLIHQQYRKRTCCALFLLTLPDVCLTFVAVVLSAFSVPSAGRFG